MPACPARMPPSPKGSGSRKPDEGDARGEYADIDLSEPAQIGHNSKEPAMSDTIAADQLRLFIERVERLEEEKKGMADDIRDVFSEAKGQGYDVKTMRAVIRLRKMEKDARDEAQYLLATYASALGMQLNLNI
jgi:uncharacterized protein (UPF0335 family)